MSHVYAGLTGVSAALAACATWRGWYDVAVLLTTGAMLLGLVARSVSVGAANVHGKETR